MEPASRSDAGGRVLRLPAGMVRLGGATQLIEEPGTLEEVARLVRECFLRYLSPEDER